MTEQDKQLQQLYQQRKSAVKTPTEIKQVALGQSKQSATVSPHSWPVFGRQMGMVTACVGLLALGLLVRHTITGYQEPEYVHANIEYHALSDEAVSVNTARRIDYENATQAFQESQLRIAIHHKKLAQIASIGDGWELKMCDNSALSISPMLLAELAANNALKIDIERGDFVQIAFSDAGRILAIEKQPTTRHC
ncbi:hypothetical protein QTP81_13075 [Alteromonas sp. ASW11-36]|uniref:Uncharacterized protein n=1 Tax=Alteromonas arenosi TaxID=3055817 RepID=A0ABT7SZB4_9ALTE|nr:hypothetical protein [Alteromonas sp. ASW11-36]MDM7861528.1 hypothetical protein [Alteromonas sp. ASW11-36]